jgi:hypothetical protein
MILNHIQRCAIFAYVSNTQLSQFDNRATIGVADVANEIKSEIESEFDEVKDLGPQSTVESIVDSLSSAADELTEDGFCLFYFHGHGDSVAAIDKLHEIKDQALVCHDGYLLDNVIDGLLSRFKSNHRILTIVDSCSSETVIEWSKYSISKYPQIIHISSATDEGKAYANRWGGIMSRMILDLVYNLGFSNYTYETFARSLQGFLPHTTCIVQTSENVKTAFLNRQLFN